MKHLKDSLHQLKTFTFTEELEKLSSSIRLFIVKNKNQFTTAPTICRRLDADDQTSNFVTL